MQVEGLVASPKPAVGVFTAAARASATPDARSPALKKDDKIKNGHTVLIVAPSGAALEVSWRRPHGAGTPAAPSGPPPSPRPDPPHTGLAATRPAHPPAGDSSAR